MNDPSLDWQFPDSPEKVDLKGLDDTLQAFKGLQLALEAASAATTEMREAMANEGREGFGEFQVGLMRRLARQLGLEKGRSPADLRRDFLAGAAGDGRRPPASSPPNIPARPQSPSKPVAAPPPVRSPCAVAGCGEPAREDLLGIYLCAEHVRIMALGIRQRQPGQPQSRLDQFSTFTVMPSTFSTAQGMPFPEPPAPPPPPKPKAPRELKDVPARTRRVFGS